MEQLFKTVLDVSIAASALCVLILFARPVIGRRPTPLLTLLGMLLIIRLAIPVMIPSPISVLNIFSGITVGQAEEKPAALPPAISYDVPDYAPDVQYNAPEPVRETDNMVKAEPVIARTESTAEANNEPVYTEPVITAAPLSGMEIAAIVWLAGIAVIGACIVLSNLRFGRELRKNRTYTTPGFDELLAACKEELGIKKDICTVQLSGINTAAVYGIFKPRLLVSPSFGWLRIEEKRHVLLHELAHIKRRDTLLSLLITALNVVYWFNPLVWAAFALMRGDMEVMCDAVVLKTLGDRRGYASTLLNLAQSRGPRPRLVTALFIRGPQKVYGLFGVARHSFNGLFISTDGIKRRIKMITRYRKKSALFTAIALILVIAIAAVGCTGPAATVSPEATAGNTAEATSGQKLVTEYTLDISSLPKDEARQANIEKAAGLLNGAVFPGVDETQTDEDSKYTWVDLGARLGKITADEGWVSAAVTDIEFLSKIFGEITYNDDSGSIYSIDKNGNITKQTDTAGDSAVTSVDPDKIVDKTEVSGGMELVMFAVIQAVSSAGMDACYSTKNVDMHLAGIGEEGLGGLCGSGRIEKYINEGEFGVINSISPEDISLKIKASDSSITASLYCDKEIDVTTVYTSADIIPETELVGYYMLDFSAIADDEARVANIKKTAEMMDGMVFPRWEASLTDDEEFKRNIGIPYALGPITEEAGWKNAAWTGWGPVGACIHETDDTSGYFKEIEDQDIWTNVPETQVGGGIEIAAMAFFRASQVAGMSGGSGYASPEDMELYLADKSKFPEPPEDSVDKGGGVDAVNDYASDLTLRMRVRGSTITAAFYSNGPVQKADYTLPAHVSEAGDKTRAVTAHYSLDLNNDWDTSMQFNIEKALGMLNGSVIKPGEKLSLNKVLGERNAANGWKEGEAIVDGAYTKQYGHGVGAVATALYNAALRAELKINDVTHAAIKSAYVPGGLDATISSAGPDLVIENSHYSDITIEAKVTDDKYIDIYIYGPELGYTVDFFSEGNIGDAPPPVYVYNKSVTPDGAEIAQGDEYQWCESRGEETYKIYKVIKRPGDVLGDAAIYEMCTYPALQGYIYVNGPEPQTK